MATDLFSLHGKTALVTNIAYNVAKAVASAR